MERESSLGGRLRRLMEEEGLSYEQMGERLGMNPQTLNRYVLGQREPKIGTASAMAAALGVDPLWLLADYVPGGTAEDAALDELHRRLLEKVNAGDIGGAEDLLFAESDPDDRRYLELAVDFYARLNDLTDAQLEAAGFGRDELEEGLRDMAGRFGVSLL